jgi:hypothetical protein
VTNGADKPEFDENAVLEELERLRGAIRLARTKREEKVAEFETFMRDTRMASKRDAARAVGVPEDELELEMAVPVPPPVRIPDIRPAPAAPAVFAPPPPPLTFQPAAPAPTSPSRVSRLDDMSEANEAFPDPVPQRAIDKYIIAGGAAVLVVALLLVSLRSGDSGISESPAAQAPQTAAPSAPPGAAGPANLGQPSQPGGTAATPATSLPLQVELVAVRKVWMRVTVDGDRAIEDEVEQGQRLRFGANKSIVIRAGDAGSVTVAVDGQAPAPLGPSGQTVTRTLVPRAK